jgi:hypothetical protein
MREENKLFMGQFRLLIKDLEVKFNKERAKEKKEKEVTFKKGIHLIRTTIALKPLGTLVLSGDLCPESGIWTTEGEPIKTVSIRKGNKMPVVGTIIRQWKLIDYKLIKQQ